ncbi:MAG: nicotinamide-nucleotide amidohydrolase family protein, partial [Clostridia bacterium]|nr:nicotinamide-nucleotide amidohydrolase family protein [Clostridia bacterium]
MAKIQHMIHTFGLSESEVAERIAELLMSKNPTVDTQPDHGGVSIIVTADSFNDDDAEILCKPIMDTAIDCLGTFVSSIDESIEENVVHSLANNHMQIALAESCTAGKLASRITEVPGASQVFECGIVSYSHEVKHSLLGVKKELLEEKGAVCAEVASAMANGARLLGNAAIGVAITGVAGPEPSDGQPVGTVYLALADSRRVWVRKIEEPHKSREEIREAAVFAALDLTRRYLEALPGMMAGSQPLEKHGPEKIITPSEVKKQTFGDKVLVTRAHGKAELIRRLTIWLLILVLLAISGLAIYYFYYRSIQNEQIYEDLEQAYNAPASVSSVDTSHYPKDMLSRFYALYDRNVDIGGWISIDDTKISYPVMTNAQGNYYASHDFDKSKSSYGVPYFSTSTKVLSKSNQNNTIPNYTILGNRTDDGQMLSSVCDYRDKGFFLQHQFLTMNTIYEAARWQVCGVMIIDSADNNKEFDYTKNTFKNKEERK